MRRSFIALTVIFLILSFDAYGIEVGSIADARFNSGEHGWTLDGFYMTATREKLLKSSNFGPGGTVPEKVNIIDIAGTVDYTTLSQFDIFFIGYLYDSESDSFSASELQAFQNWVNAGGTMIITCDETSFDAVCSAFGPVPSASNATAPVNPTGAGSTHPVFDGPFGAPSALLMSGTKKYFDNTGGFTVLAEDQGGHPVVLEGVLGSGRVIVFTDVDIISDLTLTAGSGISSDNDKFLGNLIAYLADEAVETFFFNAGLNGNWWYGPDRSGEGAQLELSDGGSGKVTLVAMVYSYDNSGNPIFLLALGTSNGSTTPVTVYSYDGGRWGAAFDPNLVNESQWGTGTFTTSNCRTIHMMLAPNVAFQLAGYTDIEYDMMRLTTPLAPCPMALPD